MTYSVGAGVEEALRPELGFQKGWRAERLTPARLPASVPVTAATSSFDTFLESLDFGINTW